MTDHTSKFGRTIGVHYSGAETADSSLKALRVYQTYGDDPACEVSAPPGAKKYWTRRGLAEWLIETLDDEVPTIVGIDHGFSFPMRYFERHGLVPDWDTFLDDFCLHWPTDKSHTYVDFVRNGPVGNGAARTGAPRWRRLTEEAIRSAKSVFQFEGHRTIAKSTHAGLPWLRTIRIARPDLHIWPFDGWQPPHGATVIAEVYPRLWSATYPKGDQTASQHDAYSVAHWLQEADHQGLLDAAFAPPELQPIAATGAVEGWILGSKWTHKEGNSRG